MKPETKPFSEAQDELLHEHARRYGETLKLSVAAAFAGLFFILQFEELFPPDTPLEYALLGSSWVCFLTAALLGTASLAFWVVHPKKRLAELNISRDERGKPVVVIESTIPRHEALVWWFHHFALAGGIGCAAAHYFVR